MSFSRPKLAIGVIISVITLLAISLAIFLPRPIDEIEPLADADREPPMPFPTAWAALDANEKIGLTLKNSGPSWTTSTGTTVFTGPFLEGIEFQWSNEHTDGWTIHSGQARSDDVDLFTSIWTAPGFPAAIIDIDVRIRGEALRSPLSIATSAAGFDAEVLTGALRRQGSKDGLGELDVMAARFGTEGPTIQIHSPDGALGHTTEAGDELAIDWMIWPGVDDGAECFDERTEQNDDDQVSQVQVASLRLVIQFGEQPMLAPMPVPLGTVALGTPIFVDAPERGGNAWADGRARNAEDYARRLRALAYGHSDRGDPRHGNGGLLAGDMGGVFVVPEPWWDDESIIKLRNSLEDRDIEIISSASSDQPATSAKIIDQDDCASLFAPSAAGNALPTPLLHRTESTQSFDHNLASPLPLLIKIGQSTTDRDELLDRLFQFDRQTSLFSSGSHRALFIPIVATRNPLEDIAGDKILSPDHGGHWTLHDSLTRRLTMREMTVDSAARRSTSFAALQTHRTNHRVALPYWMPDGSIHNDHNSAAEIFAFGNTESLDVESAHPDLTSWRYDKAPPVKYDGTLLPILIEVN